MLAQVSACGPRGRGRDRPSLPMRPWRSSSPLTTPAPARTELSPGCSTGALLASRPTCRPEHAHGWHQGSRAFTLDYCLDRRCPMSKTISVGELRQNPTRMLREVKAGATYTVTDHGEPIAEVVAVRGPRWVCSEDVDKV